MEDRHRRIEEIAYRLWELAGRPDGESDRFWHAAITEYNEETRRLSAVAKELAAEQKKPAKAAPAKPPVKPAEAKTPAKTAPAKPPVTAKPKVAEAPAAAVKKAEAEPAAKPKAPAKRK